MSNYGDTQGYEVGYGRPPISGTFKAGISGNPSGRPKMPSDFGAKVVQELNSKLTITENGKQRVITKDEALVKQTVNKALSGNLQAMRLVIEIRGQEREKVAEDQRLSPNNLAGVDVRDLTTDELIALIQAGAEESVRAKLEKSLRVELRKSIKAELMPTPESAEVVPRPPGEWVRKFSPINSDEYAAEISSEFLWELLTELPRSSPSTK